MIFSNRALLSRSNFKNSAATPPQIKPISKNHGNCPAVGEGNFGTEYHGSIPKNVREVITDITAAHTSGANRFMEKLPSTISDANTAPVIGAL